MKRPGYVARWGKLYKLAEEEPERSGVCTKSLLASILVDSAPNSPRSVRQNVHRFPAAYPRPFPAGRVTLNESHQSFIPVLCLLRLAKTRPKISKETETLWWFEFQNKRKVALLQLENCSEWVGSTKKKGKSCSQQQEPHICGDMVVNGPDRAHSKTIEFEVFCVYL